MSELYIGLMSGTSLDGIDAALVDFSAGQTRLIDFHYQAFPAQLRAEIQAISMANAPILLTQYGQLDSQLGILFANAVLGLLAKNQIAHSDIAAIGSHGQTVYHAPDGDFGFTLQIGDPNRIAQLTGITTVADFRRRDIAAGGQGAPLVPAFHQAVFANSRQTRVIANIGGIANITVLRGDEIVGFDTGPGNTLLDGWCQLHCQLAYDNNGAWAASGQLQQPLLAALLADPYFKLAPPKSTGKEYFSLSWLQTILNQLPKFKPEDVQATLLHLTADSLIQAIQQYAPETQLSLICGGGAHNQPLIQLLTNKLPHQLQTTLDFGIHPDHVEAMAFAWLARQTIHSLSGNLPSVTGAKQPVILGGVYSGYPKTNIGMR